MDLFYSLGSPAPTPAAAAEHPANAPTISHVRSDGWKWHGWPTSSTRTVLPTKSGKNHTINYKLASKYCIGWSGHFINCCSTNKSPINKERVISQRSLWELCYWDGRVTQNIAKVRKVCVGKSNSLNCSCGMNRKSC
jgi:hypothetical protein